MNVYTQSLPGLKRHFLGSLSTPPRMWLEPKPTPRVSFAAFEGMATDGRHCEIDFGVVASPGTERRIVRIANSGQRHITVTLAETPAWLYVNWCHTDDDVANLPPGGLGVELELTADHDVTTETRRANVITLQITDIAGRQCTETIAVRLTAMPARPIGDYDFHGLHPNAEFDFGVLDPYAAGQSRPSCTLSFRNKTSSPLIVSFAGLPDWLAFGIGGHQRHGPIEGRFFERAAPCDVTITPIVTPRFFGNRVGTVTLHTNDSRPELKRAELRFRARIVCGAASLHVDSADDATAADKPVIATARVENWGSVPARIRCTDDGPASLAGPFEVPPARNGSYGVERLRFRIDPARLSPGVHDVGASLSVENGTPAVVKVVFRVHVEAPVAQHRPPNRVFAAAAIAAFLLLAIVIVLSVQGLL